MAVQKKQDLRVVDKYFLIKLVIWTRKQDLRVVDKYFLIKLVTWTRDEIVYTYQSRSENKSNYYFFFFAFIIRALKKWECGTRDGGRVEGEGRGGNKVCDLCEVTCQACRKNSPGTCATVRSAPSLFHSPTNWPMDEANPLFFKPE